VRLNGEGRSGQPGRGFAKSDDFCPCRIGADDRMIEKLGKVSQAGLLGPETPEECRQSREQERD
jgi:hypothetical protein